MLKVLLVDDEYTVLKGMEAMLTDQEKVKLEISTAIDAVDALERLDQVKPDVIIADINMPEIDGLTFIGLVRDRGVKCKFIICTGFDRLEYLHQAIRQQVTEYLLKPIDSHVLLTKLCELDVQKSKDEQETLSLIKLNLLYREKDAPLPAIGDIKTLLPATEYHLCVIPGDDAYYAHDVEKKLSKYFDQVVTLHQIRNYVFLLGSAYALSQQELQKVFVLLNEEIPLRWGCSPAIQFDAFNSMNVTEGCSLLFQAVANMILHSLPISDLECQMIDRGSTRPLWLWNADEDMMEEHKLRGYLRTVIDELDGAVDKAYARVFADFSANDISLSMIFPSASDFASRFHSFRSDTMDVSGLYRAVSSTFAHSIPEVAMQEVAEQHSKIDHAMSYIRQSYREDISLDSVAAHVGLHPSYLSNLFKKKNGKSFLYYLHTERLKYACHRMLQSPNLSLEKIAEQSGYRSTNYFYKAFRQRFGTTPREWLRNRKDETR